MPAALRGEVGEIKWRYYTAAGIRGFSLVREKGRGRVEWPWHLKASVILSDAFKMAQTPLHFIAQHKKGEWRWPIQPGSIDFRKHTGTSGGILTARLGLEERSVRNAKQKLFR